MKAKALFTFIILLISLLNSCERQCDIICVQCINTQMDTFIYCGGVEETDYFYNKLSNDSTHCELK